MREAFMYLLDETGDETIAVQTESIGSIENIEFTAYDGDTFKLDFIDGDMYFFRREVAPFNWNVPA